MSIQTLRDKSEGIVAKILIALIVLVFALFGFGQITTFLAPTPRVATVDGQKITQQEMELAVERNRRMLLARDKSADIDEDQLRKTVLQNLINRKLLSIEADSLGLFYGDKSLDKEIVNTPVFQVKGKFSPDRFQQILGGAGYTPLSYRSALRTDKRLQQMVNGIEGSAFITSSEAGQTSRLEEQTRDIAYLRISMDKLEPKVKVTDEEIKAFYNNHPADFMSPERVKLAYIELNKDELFKKVKVTDAELKSWYEQNESEYTIAATRDIAHILIATNAKVTPKQAKAKSEEIYKKIENGASFAAMAKKYSQDPGSASKGGDLGFNPKGSFVKKFEDVAWSLKKGQISKPFETQFGYHIVKVLGIKPKHTPSFAEVRAKVEQAYREQQAEGLFVTESGKLSDLAFESPDLKTPAEKLGLTIKTTGYLSRKSKTGIAANSGVMKAAFSPDVLADGNNSDVIHISPTVRLVLRVVDHKPEALKPLGEVKTDIHDKLVKQKATKMAEAEARQIVDMLNKGDIAHYVADKYGLSWKVVANASRNQSGMPRSINEEAFSLAPPPQNSKSVGYAVLPNGDSAVVSVTNVVNGGGDNVSPSDLASLQRILSAAQGRYEFREFRNELAKQGNITKGK